MTDSICILNIVESTTVDGPGFRTAIYAAGCPNRCPGCHNPESWDMANGTFVSIEELMATICADPFADVTFSGGDPMFQPEGFTELARQIKRDTDKTIWCYTGYTFEEIRNTALQNGLLNYIDVLIDGRYEQALRDETLYFRGSRNQRLIDVRASLQKQKIVLMDYHPIPVI